MIVACVFATHVEQQQCVTGKLPIRMKKSELSVLLKGTERNKMMNGETDGLFTVETVLRDRTDRILTCIKRARVGGKWDNTNKGRAFNGLAAWIHV